MNTTSAVCEFISKTEEEWIDRAEKLLRFAVENVRDVDVVPTVTEALAALYLATDETPDVVRLDTSGYRDNCERLAQLECSCPAELIARGGWTSRCPIHGTNATTSAE